MRRHRGWRDTGFSRPVPGPRHEGRSMRWAFFLAALFLCLSGCSRPGCTCGTARNISNHGGLSYAYPMPRRPRRRVSCHPAGRPKYTRLGPPAMTTYWRGTQWKRRIRPPAGGAPLTPYNLAPFRPETSCSTAQTAALLLPKSFPSSYSALPLGQILEHPDGLASV